MMKLWQKAKKHINRFRHIDYSVLEKVVLSQAELQQLRNWAQENNLNNQPSPTRVRQSYGEQESHNLGHGLEFEHSRVYRAGDEKKHINWRLSARMQELHVKQFNEFQQRRVYILLDTLPNMRFGTRRRTKIAQALRAALYIAHSAKIRHCQVFAIVVDASRGNTMLQSDYDGIEDYLNRAYPPQPHYTAAQSAAFWQEHLAANKAGNHLVIAISDFQFVPELNASEWRQFNQLLQSSTAIAVQIYDPIEKALPKSGIFNLSPPGGGDTLDFDMSNRALHENFSRTTTEFYQLMKERLRLTFLDTIAVQTDEERIDGKLHQPLISYL